jgi:hypothetical protein
MPFENGERFDQPTFHKLYDNAPGVMEYLVVLGGNRRVEWYLQKRNRYIRRPESDGRIESVQFPGLKLDCNALFDDDEDCLLKAVDECRATPEFARFAKADREKASRKRRPS